MSVLVPVADDTDSEAVLDTAIALADGLDEQLSVVHIVDETVTDTTATRMRDTLRERLADAPVVSTVSLEHVGRLGSREEHQIGKEVLALAADSDVSQIVMGHQPKGISGHLWTGDAAFAVVEEATVPVTIVPAERVS